jgi:two-component system chemotaxis response regulator CheY
MNILIAEDDNLSRELLRRIVEFDGHHTAALARDGVEAWSLLGDTATAFNACIFDIYMPQKSGLTLVEDMRKEERLRRIPVILCTAADDLQTVKRAAALGVHHYIVKPYNRAVVLGKLGHIAGEVADDGTLENPETVCARLGIEGDTRRAMLETLVGEAAGWCAALREAKDRAQVEDLAIRGRGIRGSCLNLGAKRAAAQINAVETLLHDFLGRPAEAGAALPAPVTSALADLEKAIEAVAGRVKAAA